MSSIIVRNADYDDTKRVVECVHALLKELSGDSNYPLDLADAENVCFRTILGREEGDIYVAHPDGEPANLVGCLTVSYAAAMRYGGSFATLEELWVHPDYRSAGVGAQLVAAARRFTGYIEVGLPVESFAQFVRTQHFYESLGFTRIGPRMRLAPKADA